MALTFEPPSIRRFDFALYTTYTELQSLESNLMTSIRMVARGGLKTPGAFLGSRRLVRRAPAQGSAPWRALTIEPSVRLRQKHVDQIEVHITQSDTNITGKMVARGGLKTLGAFLDSRQADPQGMCPRIRARDGPDNRTTINETVRFRKKHGNQIKAAKPQFDTSVTGKVVARGGIEPPTRGFSIRCSTN